MATQNTVNIGINVTDNGSAKKVVKSFQEIEQAAARAQRSAQGLGMSSGGTPGSRAVYAKSAPSGSQQALSNEEYNRGRGSMGSTGASARDFANQAQGLGGLVRVYATFAANLFAVSAAFNALREAANTTSMIKGLDQLGAQGGRNLGALSKRVAELSDGAVTMREAMTATAQATAAGMSAKNLERLTVVAKSASQALGLNMPDALSRLSRGITKLEPELLDELGLFVKVEDSVTNYARSVGKSAAALTDFERRHAFAIAAIEQGEKKFGSIQMDANPYNKLLASITNLAQKTLEVVNTGLTPLLTILSQSPMALGATLAGIAAILLKQAIPAIGMYRENAKRMADEAHDRVLRSVKDQQEAASVLDAVAASKAEKAYQLEKTTQDRIAKLQKARFSQELLGKDLRSTLKKNPFDITPEETSALKARANALLASDDDTYKKQGTKLSEHLVKMDNIRAESAARGDAAASAREARDAKWYSHQEQMQKNLDRLNRASAKRQVLAGVADTAATLGPAEAFRQLSAETKKLDAGPAAKSFTMLRGSLTIASSAAVTALNAFGPWIAIFGLISAAVSGLISYLSQTNKESVATAQAFEGVSSSIENVTRTMEAMEKRSPLEKISVQAIEARATAFSELATSIALANQRAFAEIDKMGKTDRFVDWVKKLWSGDVQTKLNEAVAQGIQKSFETMESGPAADKVRKTIKDVLKIDNVDAKSIEQALDSLPEAVRRVKLDTITAQLKDVALAAEVSAAKGVELRDSYGQAAKQLQDLRNSFIPSDAVSKLGSTIIESANKLNLALQDPVQTLNAMNAAVKDSNSLSLFPPETASYLASIKTQIDNVNLNYGVTVSVLEDLEKQTESLKRQRDQLEKEAGVWGVERDQIKEINEQLKALESRKTLTTSLKLKLDTEINSLSDKFKDAIGQQFAYGAKLISDKLGVEWAKAGSAIGNAIAGILGDTKSGIEMRAKYESAALQAQKQQILTQIALIKSNESLAISIEQAALDEQKKNADANDMLIIAPKQAALDKRRKRLDEPVTRGSTAQLAKDIEAGTAGAKESLGYVMAAEGAFASLANISAQMGVVAIKKAADLVNLRYKQEQDEINAQGQSLKARQESYGVLESIIGADSQLLIQQKQSLAVQQLDFEAKAKSLDLSKQIAVFEELKKKASAPDKALIDADIKIVTEKQKQTEETYKQLQLNLKNKNLVESTKNQYETLAKEEAKAFTRLQESQALESDRLGMAENMLEAYKQLNAIGEQEYLREKLQLENAKARLDTQTKIDQLRKGANETTANAEQIIDQSKLALKTATPEQATALNQKIQEQNELIKRTNESSDTQVAGLLKQLEVRLQINNSTSTLAIEMQKVAGVTQSLTSLFGDLGTKIGNTVEELVKYTMGSDAMASRHAESLRNMTQGSDEYNEKVKQNAKERQVYEINGEMKAASVAKSIFKEKTAAYKILNTLEKFRAAQSIAISIKETAVKLGLISTEQAASMAAGVKELAMKANNALISIGIDIPKIYAATIGQLGIFGPPVAAAMIAAFLGRSGKSSATFVPTAEQRQETQGTAMSYDSQGNKVQTRRGVFGDTDAKSESIANSLEIIRDNSVAGLSYDNKMLRALENLNEALGSAAKELFRIRGLRSGSLLGTVEGTNTSGGLFGISGLFGKTTTKSIIDSGIQLQGSFYDLAKGISGTIKTFETVSTTVKKSGFFGIGGSTRTSVATTFRDLAGVDPKAFESLTNAFNFAADTLYSVADTAGVASDVVTTALKSISVNEMASLRGLTGEAFTKELSAVIGAVLDDASLAIFSSFETYAEFGEGMLETVVRVVDTNKKVNQALQNIGLSNSLNKLTNDVTEALSRAAGGLSELISQYEFFSDNFLTKADRMLPVQRAVITKLAEMGYATVDTKDEFVALVRSLDVTTAAGRKTYQELMDLAPGFKEIIDTVEDQSQALKDSAQSFRNFITQIKEFKSSLLLGSASTLTPEQKYAEAKAQFENLYSQALAGDSVAMSKVSSSAQSFLDASKTYFASSAAYTDDFNTVLNKLDAATVSAGASASIAELQLSTLNIHTTLLSDISTNIATLAGVPQAARGGMVSGLTMVGELGPELVDFSYPGRVYTAEQTRGMFAPQQGLNGNVTQVVQELRQVKQEIAQLRKEQQQQTGDLIVSNYDANQQASKEVATAVVDTSNDSSWADRSKPQLR